MLKDTMAGSEPSKGGPIMRGTLATVVLLFTVLIALIALIADTALAQKEAPAGPPYRVGGEVTRPEKVSGDPPQYTEIARRARISGVVIIEAVIDEQGNVTSPRVLKGLPMGLDRQAVEAIETWKFKPATLHGRAVPVYYILTVNFQVESDLSFGARFSEFKEKYPEFAGQMASRRYVEAEAFVDRLAAEGSKDPALHLARSYALMAQGLMEDAWSEARAYDGPDPDELFYFFAVNAHNQVYTTQDTYSLVEMGLEAIDRALTARPDNPDAIETKVELLRDKAGGMSDEDEETQAIRAEADRLEQKAADLRAKKKGT
jgi:TonB family protein